MPDTLETLLLQLASMKEIAQQIVAAEYDDEYEPDDFDWDGENRIWLGLEQSNDGGWGCGWLMKPDEATEFVLEASGRTPVEAALALKEKMREPSVKPIPTWEQIYTSDYEDEE